MASFDASPFGLVSEWLTLILSRHHSTSDSGR